MISVSIAVCFSRRNKILVCPCQIRAVQSEIAVLGAVSSHTILCCQIVAAKVFQTELIACGKIHIVDSYPSGQILQCVIAVCICACCIRRVVRLPLAAVIIILYCLDGDICNCRLVLCCICRIICRILDTIIVVINPDSSGDVTNCQLCKTSVITRNIFFPENIPAVQCIIRAVRIRSCTSKIGACRQIAALCIQVTVSCGIFSLLIPGNGVLIRHFACHLQLIVAEIGFAVSIAERINIVKFILAVCIRRENPIASGGMIRSVCIPVVLLQRNFYTRNIAFAFVLQSVIVLILPDTPYNLRLFNLLQTAVPVCLVCGICNVIVAAVIVFPVFCIRLRLCFRRQNEILIRCCQIEVLALIRAFQSLELTVTACLCDTIQNLTVSILRQCIQFQLIACQIPFAVYFHKCGHIIKAIISITICIYAYRVVRLYPCSAVPVGLFQRHGQIVHAVFFRRHVAIIICIIPDSPADGCRLECPDTAVVFVLAVAAFRNVINSVRPRNCTVCAVVVRIILRYTSGMLSCECLCFCCGNQIFLLTHQSEFAVIPVQLIVIGKYCNCIAVRQRIQMQLIAGQIPLAVYFCIGGNAFEVILSIGICHCLHCDCCLFPGSSIQIILIQCQVQIAASAFAQIHYAVIVAVIPDSSVHFCGLNGFQSAVVYADGISCGNNVILYIVIRPYIVRMESRLTASGCAGCCLFCQQDILVRLVEVHCMVCVQILRSCQQIAVDAASCRIQYLILGHSVAIRNGIQPQTIASQVHFSVNRYKRRLLGELIYSCVCRSFCGEGLIQLPVSGIIQIILIQIYGLLCQHSRFTGFLQAAVILIQPNHALKLSGFKRFQTAVINVSHVCIQYGIVFLVCDSISQIIGSVALCRLCCQEVISIARCSQIVRFCDPVAVCFCVIQCLTISCHRITIRYSRTNAVICQLVYTADHKVSRHLGKLVYAVLVSCDCLICVHLDILLCSDIIAILLQSNGNAALALFTAVQNAVVIRIFPDPALYCRNVAFFQTGIQIFIISCCYQIIILLLCSIRRVDIFDVRAADICPVVIRIRFCIVGLRTCLCLLCQNHHFMIAFQHCNRQVTSPLAVLCAVISICDIQLAVNLGGICIVPILCCRIILRHRLQENLIACQILYAVLFHIGGKIVECILAVCFCLMCPECCVFQHPFVIAVEILLQVYNCRIFAVMVFCLVLILNTVVIGVLPDNAADRCRFKCLQTAVIAGIISGLNQVIGKFRISFIDCRIIIENIRFKIGVSVYARLCLRLRFLCGDEIIAVCRRCQIGYDIIICISCSVLFILCYQMAVHHLGFRIAVLPIAGNGIVFHAAGQRQQLQTIMGQYLFPIDFRICGNTGECVLAVCISFHSTVSACYRNIFAVLQHILLQLNSRSGNSLFIELCRAVRIGHGIADTIVVKCLPVFPGSIFTAVLPQIAGYFRSLNLRKAAAVIQQALCLTSIIMGILIVDYIVVAVCCFAGNDNDVVFFIIVVIGCCNIAVCIILKPVITNERVLHIAGILQVTVFRRTVVRILLILGDRILLVQICILSRIDIQPIACQICFSILFIIAGNILEYIRTGF